MISRKSLKLCCFLMSFLFVQVLFAQDKITDKLSFGLEISPSYTWLNTDNPQVDSDGGTVKLNGGLNVFYNLQDRYSIVTGIHLNGYGGSLKGDFDVVEYDFREVEIPFALKLRTGNFDVWRYTAQLGLGIGFLYNSSATKLDGDNTYDNERFDYKLMPIRALYNLSIGTEYDLTGAILTARINYKGWFSNLYFYDNGIDNPSRNLDLQIKDGTAERYSRDIIFQPSALEFIFGVMF